jgi:hypothetical protein
MRKNNINLAGWWGNVRLCLMGGLMIAFVFLTPDVGQQDHKSFFAVASASTWGRFGELPLAWCSLKIVLLGIGAVLMLATPLRLANRKMAEILAMLFLALAIMAVLLSWFGVYELVKAVL